MADRSRLARDKARTFVTDDRDLYDRACAIFADAVELAPPDRADFVVRACAGVNTVRDLVLQMLEIDIRAESGDDLALVEHARVLSLVGGALEDKVDGVPPGAEPAIVRSGDIDQELPERVGEYRILGRLGAGGMGIVYLAEQEAPRRRVALKVLRSGSVSAEIRRRFRLEGEVHGRLTHAGIAQVHATGVASFTVAGEPAGEAAYLAMEYVDGRPLDVWALETSPSVEQRIETTAAIAEAVSYAHDMGVMHRDLKPANIMITEAGEPKVIDFGVARALDSKSLALNTVAGQLVGTLRYMSPEQVSGRPDDIDTRSDVYSLGVVLYELLAGRLPYDIGDSSIAEAAQVIQNVDAISLGSIDLGLRGDLENIAAKALEKEKARRYQTAQDFADDLRRFLALEPVRARPASALYVLRKYARRNRPIVAGALIALVALIAGTVAAVIYAVKADRQAELAVSEKVRANDATYLAATRSAVFALESQDLTTLRDVLDMAPVDRRGWEWHHLRARLGKSRVYFGDWGKAAMDEDGRPVLAITRDEHYEIIRPDEDRTLVLAGTEYSVGKNAIPGEALSLSPNGSRAAGMEDGRIVIWDTRSGAILRRIDSRKGMTGTLVFSQDERKILRGVDEDPLAVIDIETGRTTQSVDMEWLGAACFSRDGRNLFAIDGEGCLATIDIETRAIERSDAFGMKTLHYTPRRDEREFVFRATDGTGVFLHDVTSGRNRTLRPHMPYAPDVRASGIGYAADDLVVVPEPDDSLSFVEIGSGLTRMALSTPLLQVHGVVASPETSCVVAFGEGGCYLIDRAACEQPLVLRGHRAGLYAVAVSPDGSMIASGGWDHAVRIWDVARGRLIAELPTGTRSHDVHARSSVQNLSFSSDGTELVGWARGERRWNLLTGARTDGSTDWDEYCRSLRDARISDFNFGVGIVSSNDGQVFARPRPHQATAPATAFELLDRGTRREFPWPMDCLALHPTRDRIAFASRQGLKVADRLTDEIKVRMDRSFEFFALEYTPDGRRIVSGSRDGVVRFWDSETLELIAELRGHEDYVYSLRFSPDGTRLFTAGGDGTVRIWDTVDTDQRRRDRLALEKSRRRMRPSVETWLSETDDPMRTMERVRSAPDFSDLDRRAALHLVIELSSN